MNKLFSINAQISDTDNVVIGMEINAKSQPKAQYDAMIATIKVFAGIFASGAAKYDPSITKDVVLSRIVADITDQKDEQPGSGTEENEPKQEDESGNA